MSTWPATAVSAPSTPARREPILVDIVGPGTAPTFAVYSLSAPENPVKLAQLSTSPYTFLTDLSFLWNRRIRQHQLVQHQRELHQRAAREFHRFDFSSLFPVLLSALSSGPGSSGASVMPNALALATVVGAPATAYITSTTSSGASTTGIAALDVVNISSPQSMQGIAQVTVSNAAIFLGFGYDENLLLVTGNTSSFRNPGVPDFSINGNLTLSTMNIANVQNPVKIANLPPGYSGHPDHRHLRGAAFGSCVANFRIEYFRHRQQSAVHRPGRPEQPLDCRRHHGWFSGAVSLQHAIRHDRCDGCQRLSFGPECEWLDDLQHSDAVTARLTPDKRRRIVVMHLRCNQVQQLIFFFNVNSNLQPIHRDTGMFQRSRDTVG